VAEYVVLANAQRAAVHALCVEKGLFDRAEYDRMFNVALAAADQQAAEARDK